MNSLNDICNKKTLEDIFGKFKIDGVINFAAESHVDNSILNPEIFLKQILWVFYFLSVCFKY